MFSSRLIRPARVRSLLSDRNYLITWKYYRNYLTLEKFFQTIRVCSYSHLSLSVEKPLLIKIIRNCTSQKGLKCWNCNELVQMTDFSCLSCGKLQPPDPKMTYFQLIGIPENFDLDTDVMSNNFKTLQKKFHPDRFVQKSKEEIDISDHYSKLVNKAYTTLKNPLSRGMYLLNLKGFPTDDDSVKMNQEFLMIILEKNEEVENLSDEKALQQFQKENSKIISEYVLKTSKAFQKQDLQEARTLLMKMKYFVNIENELKKKKSAMGIVD